MGDPPSAGMTSEEVKLGIYNVKTRDVIFVKTGDEALKILNLQVEGKKRT